MNNCGFDLLSFLAYQFLIALYCKEKALLFDGASC